MGFEIARVSASDHFEAAANERVLRVPRHAERAKPLQMARGIADDAEVPPATRQIFADPHRASKLRATAPQQRVPDVQESEGEDDEKQQQAGKVKDFYDHRRLPC